MGADTQLSIVMGINHSKLFIKEFLQRLKSHRSFKNLPRSGSVLRKTIESGSIKKNECGSTALKIFIFC